MQEIFNFLPLKKFLKYDKVTVVRDPYSRLISHYKHLIYKHIRELYSGKTLIKELASPKFFVEKLYKKSKNELLPSSHHNLFAVSNNGTFYLPDHIFSWKEISFFHQYLKSKYNFKEFIDTSSEEIEIIFPSWRDISSKKGNFLEVDQFVKDNIEEFKNYKTLIEEIWQEEIILMNANKISLYGEVLFDKEKIYSYLSKFSIKKLHEISKNYRNNFYSIDLILK